MRVPLGMAVMAAAVTAIAAGATPASANAFGPPEGGPRWADNYNHTYFNNALITTSAAAMDFAMGTRLASTVMSTDKFESWNNDTDVVAYDYTYGATGWRGLWTCEVVVSSNANLCNRGTLKLNQSYGVPNSYWTCHEVGHSVGLGHSTNADSCMRTDGSSSTNNYNTHDRWHIDNFYL